MDIIYVLLHSEFEKMFIYELHLIPALVAVNISLV